MSDSLKKKLSNLVANCEYADAIKIADEILSNEPDDLFTLDNKLYALWFVFESASGTEKHEFRKLRINISNKIIKLIEKKLPSVMHFSEERTNLVAAYQRAQNNIAWDYLTQSDKESDWLKGLKNIQKAIDLESALFIQDTKVRLLLKLGRSEEAYLIAEEFLKKDPNCGDFQDIKRSKEYLTWLKKAEVKVDPEEAKKIFGSDGKLILRMFNNVYKKNAKEKTFDKTETEFLKIVSPELKKWIEYCRKYNMSRKEIDYQIYGFYGLPSFGEMIDGQDGKWVARFRSFFCGVSIIAEGDEDAVMASWAATSCGTSRIYTTHQDDWGDFSFGPASSSVSSYFYNKIQEPDSDEKFRKDRITGDDERKLTSSNKVFEEGMKKEKFQKHLGPDELNDRVNWLISIFLGISVTNNLMEDIKKAGTIKDYEAEKEYIKVWPHLSGYWLLSHMIFGNDFELDETVSLSEKHSHPAVKEILGAAKNYLSGKSINENWWDSVKIDGIRETLQEEALSKYFGPSAKKKIASAKKSEVKSSPEAKIAYENLIKLSGSDPKVKEALETFHLIENSVQIGSYDFKNQYGISKTDLYKKFAGMVDNKWEDVLKDKLAAGFKYDENHKKSGRGFILPLAKLSSTFKSFQKVIDELGGMKNFKSYRRQEMALAADVFVNDAEALKYLYDEAMVRVSEINNYPESRTNSEDALYIMLDKDIPETHRIVSSLLENTDCSGVNWPLSIHVAKIAGKYKIVQAEKGLQRVVKKELGRTDDGDRGRVINAYVDVAGQNAYETLRGLYDKKMEYIKNEKSYSYHHTDVCYHMRGLLQIPEIPEDIIQTAKNIFAFFSGMKPIPGENLYPLGALIWGVRLGKRKEFVPELRLLLSTGEFKEKFKEEWTKFISETIKELEG